MNKDARSNRFDAAFLARWRLPSPVSPAEFSRNILRPVLGAKLAIDWASLTSDFPDPQPVAPVLLEVPPKPPAQEVAPPAYLNYPVAPQRAEAEPEAVYVRDYAAWAADVKQVEAENQRRYDASVAEVERLNAERESEVARWRKAVKPLETENRRRQDDYAAASAKWQAAHTAHREWEAKAKAVFQAAYELHEPEAVEAYGRLVLMFSGLPGVSPRVFDLEYIPAEKLLIVDHGLPSPDDLMRRGEPGKAGNEFLAGLYAENNFHLVYENIVYQMCLRTIYELFMADTAGALDVVVFNGWVEARTIKTKGCVLSVQAAKEEFLKLNLARVDPKLGFKSLNGQGSDTLASLTPITPIKKSARD